MTFNPEIFKQKLGTTVLGRNFVYLPEVDSTNQFLSTHADRYMQNGTVVLTDFQTKGRGRTDHRWESQSGRNLLFSFLIRPELPAERLQLLTLQAGLSLHKTLSALLQEYRLNPAGLRLKWPNDLLLEGKKLAGILTETQTQSREVRQAVIGIGLNVNQAFSAGAHNYSFTAISLFDYIGRKIEREELLVRILTGLEDSGLDKGFSDQARIGKEWQERSVDQNIPWQIVQEGRPEQVFFHSIDEYGYLKYRTAAGEIKTLVNGEVIKE